MLTDRLSHLSEYVYSSSKPMLLEIDKPILSPNVITPSKAGEMGMPQRRPVAVSFTAWHTSM